MYFVFCIPAVVCMCVEQIVLKQRDPVSVLHKHKIAIDLTRHAVCAWCECVCLCVCVCSRMKLGHK